MAEAAVVIPFRGEWESLLPLLRALRRQSARGSFITVLSVDGAGIPPGEVSSLADMVVNGPQSGPAAARNRGWRAVEAPFVLFTDGDCIPDDDWVEKMLAGLRGEYQGIKGVYSRGGSRMIQRLAQVEFSERYRIMARRESICLADTYAAGFRREWLERLDGFDEAFPFPEHEDVDLSWRLIRAGGRIGFLPEARVAHVHRKSWIDYFRLKLRRGKWRIILLKRFPEMAVDDGYTPQTMKVQISLVPVLMVSVLLLPINPWPFAAAAFLFLLSCIPLARVASSTDPGTLPLVPVFAFWRGCALFAGALAGVMERRRTCSRQ
ncbi:MAG TPA: glycosyltransferase [Candidatus Sabulitectum sp.]|nr:glycosyltransferase [Candidatus Sabulitectum sp.]HPJ29127.1 glycosyltransferase [Candidatus Sabulitectum sp.]